MSIFDAVEKRLIASFRDRFEVETDFDPETLVLTTVTYLDGEVIHHNEFDATPLVHAVAERLRKKGWWK